MKTIVALEQNFSMMCEKRKLNDKMTYKSRKLVTSAT